MLSHRCWFISHSCWIQQNILSDCPTGITTCRLYLISNGLKVITYTSWHWVCHSLLKLWHYNIFQLWKITRGHPNCRQITSLWKEIWIFCRPKWEILLLYKSRLPSLCHDRTLYHSLFTCLMNSEINGVWSWPMIYELKFLEFSYVSLKSGNSECKTDSISLYLL